VVQAIPPFPVRIDQIQLRPRLAGADQRVPAASMKHQVNSNSRVFDQYSVAVTQVS